MKGVKTIGEDNVLKLVVTVTVMLGVRDTRRVAWRREHAPSTTWAT